MIVILGGGISGLMMSKRLQDNAHLVIDKGNQIDHSFHLHRPIPELHINPHPAKFSLGVYDGEFHSAPTPFHINKYALKIYGKLQPSNILNFHKQSQDMIYPMNKCELANALRPNNKNTLQANITAVDPKAKVVKVEKDGLETEIRYDYLVNTLPLPVLLKLLNIVPKEQLSFSPFAVNKISAPSTKLYQMTYCTHAGGISRITLIDDALYLDTVKEFTTEDDILLHKLYGVTTDDIQSSSQVFRFDPIDKRTRKELIFFLTQEYDIMLLGRYGSWSFKIANDVWDDTKLLNTIIEHKDMCKAGEKHIHI
jgi:uncharacterized ParB-like nuclease family protein